MPIWKKGPNWSKNNSMGRGLWGIKMAGSQTDWDLGTHRFPLRWLKISKKLSVRRDLNELWVHKVTIQWSNLNTRVWWMEMKWELKYQDLLEVEAQEDPCQWQCLNTLPIVQFIQPNTQLDLQLFNLQVVSGKEWLVLPQIKRTTMHRV